MENPQSSLNPTQVSTPSPTTPETTTPEAVPITPAPKKKTSKILIGVLVLLFLVAGGVFAYDYFKPEMREDENFPTPVPQVSTKPVVDEMSGWESHTVSELGLELSYPEDAIFSANSGNLIGIGTDYQGPSLVTISKYGPTQALDSEFFDGYSLTIVKIGLKGESLEQIAQNHIQSSTTEFGQDFVVQPIKPISVGQKQGLTYTVRGLGEYTHILLPNDEGSFIIVTYSVPDPTDQGYQKIVHQILSTFEFVETQGNTIGPSLGKVTGKLCYPSEFLPSGEIVAKNVQSGEIYTQNYSGNTENYTFELPVGTYHLRYQAHASANNPSIFTSYYHTLCGENPEYTYCQSTETHSIIPTLVKQGETTTDVNLCGEGTIEDSTF